MVLATALPPPAIEARFVAPSAPRGLEALFPAASFGSAPTLTPSFVPTALTPIVLAPSTPEVPGSGKAAAAARKTAADFARLVGDLMGADAEKSAAAVEGLRAMKAAHLNPAPKPKATRILDLKPMQIPAGMLEVQQKARDLRDKKDKDADDWLKENSVPVLEDYKGRKRPVDHHHEARAAWEADRDDAYTHRYFDDELHDLVKELPKERFYAVTRAMGLLYDRDQFGEVRDPKHLPDDVRGMADDPYRSLAWAVRKRGGYDKTAVPFAEFQWANFFRARLSTYPSKADFEAAVAEALTLAQSPAAKSLPGWKGR